LLLLSIIIFQSNAIGQVSLSQSNLPIVVINTPGAAEIPEDPKLDATMGIIDNGYGNVNNITDPFNDFDGNIGIEKRGSSSAGFPKRSFSIETKDSVWSASENFNILGMPKENDWILYAPYSDKSMMRNYMAYNLMRDMGWYASRTVYCEVVINGVYQGVYIMLEKIKRDDSRVDMANLNTIDLTGDQVTGGYIVKIDQDADTTINAWPSNFAPVVNFQYHIPDEPQLEQQIYIRSYFDDFEANLNSAVWQDPVLGYRSYINVSSFVDYLIMNELSRNVDGYRVSAYLHKDKTSNDSLIYAGPIWDYNTAFGNSSFYDGAITEGAQYEFNLNFPGNVFPVPFWWQKLMSDPYFMNEVECRWTQLRNELLVTADIHNSIDTLATYLDDAQMRNFTQFPILGQNIYPNAFVGQTYEEETDYLKDLYGSRMFS